MNIQVQFEHDLVELIRAASYNDDACTEEEIRGYEDRYRAMFADFVARYRPATTLAVSRPRNCGECFGCDSSDNRCISLSSEHYGQMRAAEDLSCEFGRRR